MFKPRSFLVVSLTALALSFAAGCGGAGRANISPGPMPSGETFTGVWHSPQYGEMQLVQTGNSIVGEYVHDERRGRIQGTATGDLMRFEWSERRELVSGRPNTTRGRGYFRFQVGEDNDRYLVGEWGHDDNETGGGPWRAVRDRRRRPSLSGSSTGTGGDTGGDSSGSGDDFPEASSGDAFPGEGGGSSGSGSRSGGVEGLEGL